MQTFTKTTTNQYFDTETKLSLYCLSNVKYLYKDQFGRQVFRVNPTISMIMLLKNKINKYKTLNPIIQDPECKEYLIKFNDTKHYYKSRLNYDLLFFINKSVNKKTNQEYINLHIHDMKPIGVKSISCINYDQI